MEDAIPSETGLERMISRFKQALPGWWFTLGECEKSCDASCAPTRESDDLRLMPHDERFNSGFHCDLPQPCCLSHALYVVMREAIAARHEASRLASTATAMMGDTSE